MTDTTVTDWDSRQRDFKESRQRTIDGFIKLGMHRKTASLLAYEGMTSVDDINLLGESGLRNIPGMGSVKMTDIRRALGWPDPIKPLYASLNAEAMANELRRRGWHVVRGTD